MRGGILSKILINPFIIDMDTTQPGVSMDPQSSKKQWIIAGAIVVLAIAGYAMYQRSQTVNPPQGIAPGDMNSLVIKDQDPDAIAVLVEYASVREPSFIVIHDDANGKAGAIIGTSKLLTPGEHRNVSVIMRMKAGATYYGMMHADDGNGLFDSVVDNRHLLDTAGMEIMTRFKALLVSPGGEQKG
jgi:hypothetical protein